MNAGGCLSDWVVTRAVSCLSASGRHMHISDHVGVGVWCGFARQRAELRRWNVATTCASDRRCCASKAAPGRVADAASSRPRTS